MDSIEDVEWIYQTALERAKKYNIEGVTYNLTLGVIKNIIPAIASTNSIIAAATVMEAIKICMKFSKRLDNYFMYMGHEGLHSSTMQMVKLENCKTCSKRVLIVKVEEKEIWKNIFERIIQTSKINVNPGYSVFHKADYIFEASKENGELKIINKIDENKKLEDLIKENKIDVKILFEITPEEDKNNSVKIRLKRPQDYDE